MTTLESSKTPLEDLDRISPHQPPSRKMYRKGYEDFFEQMPIMFKLERFLQQKIKMSRELMQSLAREIIKDGWTSEIEVSENEFKRTIVGMEPPKVINVETPSVEGEILKEG